MNKNKNKNTSAISDILEETQEVIEAEAEAEETEAEETEAEETETAETEAEEKTVQSFRDLVNSVSDSEYKTLFCRDRKEKTKTLKELNASCGVIFSFDEWKEILKDKFDDAVQSDCTVAVKKVVKAFYGLDNSLYYKKNKQNKTAVENKAKELGIESEKIAELLKLLK